MHKLDSRLTKRIISQDETIINAFRHMDETYQKLLLIMDGNFFIGLISAGDIQRAIIRNVDLKTKVVNVMRANLRYAKPTDDQELIKHQMLEHRMELMPVVDENKHLVNVFFWEDVFGLGMVYQTEKLDAPVVIMAGGYGSRLRPLTNIIPKPLIPIGEKTILEHIIEGFVKTGSSHFILSVNYKAELIRYYIEGLAEKNFTVEYIEEEKPLGTAGSLKLLQGRLNETFFVTNCDILIDQDFIEVWKYHKQNKNELTLVSSLKNLNIPYGTLKVGENGQLLSINEKPTFSYFINAGLYILESSLLDEIPGDTFFNITDLIEKIKKRNGKIGVYPVSEGSLIDIGSWDEYLKQIH